MSEKEAEIAALQAKAIALEGERDTLEQTVNERLAVAETEREQLRHALSEADAARDALRQEWDVLQERHLALEAELHLVQQRLQGEADLRARAKQAAELAMNLLAGSDADADADAARTMAQLEALEF